MDNILNFINGKFVPALGGDFLNIVNPATSESIGKIPHSYVLDVENAFKAAEEAWPIWRKFSAEKRGEILRKLSHLILENLEDLAQLETKNCGKPLSVSRAVDIPRSAKNFSFFADLATQISSTSYSSPEALHVTLSSPLGVVGTISPWNLPLYLLTWKIAPALACGNTVVAKPSELTPLTANKLAQLSLEAGLPAGVLNIIHGLGADCGEAMTNHPGIRAISFTGGTLTGKRIAEVCGKNLKKVSLELGGKNPTIIFADTDFEKAVSTSVLAAFSNQGQICLCGPRILIEESIYEKFKKALVEKVKALIVGDPLDEKTQVGPVISKNHLEKIQSKVTEAINLGGKILCGGDVVKLSGRCAQGYFYAPTVIEGLENSCATNQEEIFGPVVTLIPFKNEAEAITLANNSPYGLSASVWTQNLDRAHHIGLELESGMIWFNTWMLRDLRTPFGGVKNSGLGREGGLWAMRFFSEEKNLTFKLS